MDRQYPSLGAGFAEAGIFLFLLMLAAAADGASNSVLSASGTASLAAAAGLGLLFSAGVLSFRIRLKVFERNLLWLFGLFGLVNVFTFTSSGVSVEGIKTILQILIISGLLVSSTAIIRHNKYNLYTYVFRLYIYLYVFINIVILVVSGLDGKFSGLFVNSNVMAMYTLSIFAIYLIMVVLGARKKVFGNATSNLVLAILYILIVVTGSRSAIISVNIFIVVYFIFPYISARRSLYATTFLFSLLTPVLVAIFLLFSEDAGYYKNIQELSMTIFGKPNILHERGLIWTRVINIISENPVMGAGAGAVPSDFMDTGLSSHNLYLQVALQSGLLGLISMVSILWYIWMTLCRCGNSHVSRVSASFLICILFNQMFEVVLFQNNVPIAVSMWLVLSFGLAFCTKN